MLLNICAKLVVVPPIISGTGKATDLKFCRNIHRVDRNKSPWKMLGIVAVGVVRESRKLFRAPMYTAHCAVIFAIAQLSCCMFYCMFYCSCDRSFTYLLTRVHYNRQRWRSGRWTAGWLWDVADVKGAITSKIKHAIKHKTSPAKLAQLLQLQPSLAFCCSLQPMTPTASP